MVAAEGERTFIGYHGTAILSVPALLRGLTVQPERNFAGVGQLGIGFYTTESYVVALEFAETAAGNTGSYPAVVRVYARGFDGLVGEEVPPQRWWRIADDDQSIVAFDYLTAPIAGYAPARQVKFNPRAYAAVSVEIPR